MVSPDLPVTRIWASPEKSRGGEAAVRRRLSPTSGRCCLTDASVLDLIRLSRSSGDVQPRCSHEEAPRPTWRTKADQVQHASRPIFSSVQFSVTTQYYAIFHLTFLMPIQKNPLIIQTSEASFFFIKLELMNVKIPHWKLDFLRKLGLFCWRT